MLKIRCGVAGCDFSHELAKVVGSHRRRAHGIVGTSKTARTRHNREKKMTSPQRGKEIDRAYEQSRRQSPVTLDDAIAALKVKVAAMQDVIADLENMKGLKK